MLCIFCREVYDTNYLEGFVYIFKQEKYDAELVILAILFLCCLFFCVVRIPERADDAGDG